MTTQKDENEWVPFDECYECVEYPCYRDNLWQLDGMCMDFKEKGEEL